MGLERRGRGMWQTREVPEAASGSTSGLRPPMERVHPDRSVSPCYRQPAEHYVDVDLVDMKPCEHDDRSQPPSVRREDPPFGLCIPAGWASSTQRFSSASNSSLANTGSVSGIGLSAKSLATRCESIAIVAKRR